MTVDRSAIGRSNRRTGHETERQVVRWLRANGFPDACTTRSKLGHDGFRQPGDVDFHPLIVLEVKSATSGSRWPTWCRQAVAQAGPGQVPCVVRRTRGVPDVGQWEVRVRAFESIVVLQHRSGGRWLTGDPHVDGWPWMSMTMADLVELVRAVDADGAA